MERDTFAGVTARPNVDYAHLPGEENNPLMESTAHVDWGLVLLNSARHTLANTDHLVTGNVPFAPADGEPHTAPDVMVIPGAAGRSFGRYEPGPDEPLPSVCIEILSPSNTKADIKRRCSRLLRLGVGEVYVLDPIRDSVVRVEQSNEGLTETSAIGVPSPGLGLTFAMAGRHLAVCCPGGRMVRPGDDPFGWLVEETRRADAAELRSDELTQQLIDQLAQAHERANEAEQRVEQAEREIAAARLERAEFEALRAELDALKRRLTD
jgi:Uma2 family endonuclease